MITEWNGMVYMNSDLVKTLSCSFATLGVEWREEKRVEKGNVLLHQIKFPLTEKNNKAQDAALSLGPPSQTSKLN